MSIEAAGDGGDCCPIPAVITDRRLEREENYGHTNEYDRYGVDLRTHIHESLVHTHTRTYTLVLGYTTIQTHLTLRGKPVGKYKRFIVKFIKKSYFFLQNFIRKKSEKN